jgi:hypothetical protein
MSRRKYAEVVSQVQDLEKALYASSEDPEPDADVLVTEPAGSDAPVPAENVDATPEPVLPVPEPQPKADPEPRVKEGEEYWKQRASTVIGINNAQTEELRLMRAQNAQLIQTLQQMQSQFAGAGTAAPAASSTRDTEDAAAFGEDLIAAVDRRAAAKAEALLKAKEEEFRQSIAVLEQRIGSVGTSVAAYEEDSFLAKLDRAYSNWDAVNNDVRFKEWLLRYPVLQSALTVAQRNQDVEGVAEIFRIWEARLAFATRKDAPASAAPAAPATPAVSAADELKKQISPTTTSGGAGVASASSGAARIWTGTEYQAAYDTRNVKRFGREKAARLLEEADAAVREGRVNWGA